MNHIDLYECYKRYQDLINKALHEAPFPLTVVTAIGEQLNSKRHVWHWNTDMTMFLKYLDKEDQVLDFGTGVGASAVPFAFAGCQVKAIDIDDFMSEVPSHARSAQEQRFFWPKLERAFGDLAFFHYKDTIPFPDNTFDAVVAYGVLEHIPDEMHNLVVSEWRRVLKPGGYLFISYLPRKLALCENVTRWLGMPHHERLWGDREIRSFLRNHKFEILRFNRIAFCPQHPTGLSNKLRWIFDTLDWLARFTPLACLAHHFRIVTRKCET